MTSPARVLGSKQLVGLRIINATQCGHSGPPNHSSRRRRQPLLQFTEIHAWTWLTSRQVAVRQ